jgi:AcrR family transcriptional regulator
MKTEQLDPPQKDATQIQGTKLAILDAAERLFATHGFEATSLRAITSEAGVNLGAVNYHFTSKDALALAVLKRRFKPLNDRRLAMLDEMKAHAGGKPLSVEQVLEALFRPMLELVGQSPETGGYVVNLMAKLIAEPGACLKPLIQEEFAESKRRYHQALWEAMPHLTSAEVYWRQHCAYGVFMHVVCHEPVLQMLSQGQCSLSDTEDTLKRIITFCAAGMAVGETATAGKYESIEGTESK